MIFLQSFCLPWRTDFDTPSIKLEGIAIENGWLLCSYGNCRAKFPKMYGKSALRRSLIRPEEVGIDLLRPYQVFQLFKTRKRPVLEDLFRHVNPFKQIVELVCSASRVP